jgi:chromosome segregation ATPase
VLTCALGAAVIGLGIWVIILETGHESASSTSASRIDELEKIEAELSERVPQLETLVEGLEAQLQAERDAASAAAGEAEKQVDALREEVERAAEELGAEGDDLADIRVELNQLSEDAEAQLARARRRTATARDRADAEGARADLAEGCLGAVSDVLQRLYEGSDDLVDRLDEAAHELRAIAAECAPAG